MKEGKIVARYDGLCIKRQCNMYRVRPHRKGCKEEVKRYKKILKVRLEERFLRSDDYYFESKLTKAHVEAGVWICLTHFIGTSEEEFLLNLKLPESASLKKENRAKSRIEIRVSALPLLALDSYRLKVEPTIEEEEEEIQTIVCESESIWTKTDEEVQVVYVSPQIGERYKLNRRMYARHSWNPLEKISNLTVGACEFFANRELCLPSIVDRYLDVIANENPRVVGLSSIVFEAALRKDGKSDVQKYFQGLNYSSQLKYVYIPYYFYGRWSLVIYDLEKTRVENYVLTSKYDWTVREKIEQILFSLQDKLMLRRVGLLYKNTFTNLSADHDTQFASGVKVLTLMRESAMGLDPRLKFWKEFDYTQCDLGYYDSIFGHFVNSEHLPIVNTAISTEFVNTNLTVEQGYNLFAREK